MPTSSGSTRRMRPRSRRSSGCGLSSWVRRGAFSSSSSRQSGCRSWRSAASCRRWRSRRARRPTPPIGRAGTPDDLLFVSSYGDGDHRRIAFAHFSKPSSTRALPTAWVLLAASGRSNPYLRAVRLRRGGASRWDMPGAVRRLKEFVLNPVEESVDSSALGAEVAALIRLALQVPDVGADTSVPLLDAFGTASMDDLILRGARDSRFTPSYAAAGASDRSEVFQYAFEIAGGKLARCSGDPSRR